MKTVWEYSIKFEAERLIHCAHQIIVGFYKTNNFIVLPYNPNINTANIVTFPLLPYTKIPRFWEQSKKVDVTKLPLQIDSKITSHVSKLLENINLLPAKFDKTKKTLAKNSK